MRFAGAPTSSRWDPQTRTLTARFVDSDATGATEVYVHEEAYPGGWVVEASDAPGTWTSAYDPVTRVLAVTTPTTGGAHVVCVRPAEAPGCAGAPPTPPGVPGDPGGAPGAPRPVATPAVPVPGRPTYTG